MSLQPFIRHFLVVEATIAHRDVHLPETGFVAAFRFRGSCHMYDQRSAPQAAITGLWDRTRDHQHSCDHAVVIAAFTPMGASALLRQPLNEVSNNTVDLADLISDSNGPRLLCEQVYAAANHQQRINQVEHFLLRHIDPSRVDSLIAQATAQLTQSAEGLVIPTLAKRLGLSQSALERRFRQKVGCTPQRFASLVRLKRVVRLRNIDLDWTRIAHEAGYYDQAHFNRDFKRFTGMSPSSYFAA